MLNDLSEHFFNKQQEPSRLSNSLRIKTPLSKIPLVGPILFQ